MVPQISSTTDRIFCYFGLFFAIIPSNNLENQNFNKMKRLPENIILHVSTINQNHMMHDSCDMECNRQNVFLTLDLFLPF